MASERITTRPTGGTSRTTGDTLTATLAGNRTLTLAAMDQCD